MSRPASATRRRTRSNRRGVLVHHLAHRLDHGLGVLGLEDVAPHVDAGRTLLDRVVGQAQRLELGQLLAAGHDDGHRAARGDRFVLRPLGDVDAEDGERDAPHGRLELSGLALVR
ncbi:MAG: hypothetical protein V3S54_06960 [Woeseiaceae bacterium]